MKKIALLVCTLFLIGQALAQPPAGGPPGGPGGPGARPGGSNSGHLYGKLVDSAGKGISRASVLILKVMKDPATGKSKEMLLKGLTTQGNGDFSAEDLPVGAPLKLKVSTVGYSEYSQMITLAPPAT